MTTKIAKFFFIFLVLLTPKLFSQNEGITISGFVRDSTSGEALIGTNILVYRDSIDTNNPPFSATTTNSYGFYAIPKLSMGNYIIIVRNIGYAPIIDRIKVNSTNRNIQINFKAVSESIELNEVVVQGKREQKPIASTIEVNPDILRKLPTLSGEADLFKALQLLPGIKVQSDLSNGIYVRGGSPDQNLTLIDGSMVYNPSHIGNFTTSFNSNAIQSIKLIKGAYPAEYGGRLSSVLDIKLRSGTKEKEKGQIGLGLISSNMMFEGPLGNNTTFLISGRKMYYDFVQDNFLKDNTSPRYNYYDLNGKITITPSASNVFTLSGLYSNDKLTSPSENTQGYDIEWKNALANLTWLHINSNSLFITTSFSFVSYEFSSILLDNTPKSTANNYYSYSKLRDLNVKSNAEMHWLSNHILKLGFSFLFHSYSLLYSDFYDPLLQNTLNDNPDVVTSEATFFVENEGKLFSWLRTNIGLRGYYFKAQEYFSPEPHVSFQVLLNDNLSFNTAYAFTHQFLHLVLRNDIALPTDLWYPSTTNVDPSSSNQYVAGFDYGTDDKQYAFSLEGYYRDMKNLYEFEGGPSLKIDQSVADLFTKGEGEAYGVEFFANRRYGNLTGWIGYTVSWTKRKFDYLNSGKVYYPKYDRRHDISVALAYTLNDHWNFGLTWTYETGQGYTLPTGQYNFESVGPLEQQALQFNYSDRNAYRLPAYHKLDLSVSYKFDWQDYKFETFLSFYNVYNRHNPFAYYTTYNTSATSTSLPAPKINQISLFPFIPMIGITMKF
ncbi:MAG: TonB-dependent receptor [Ignavibacteriaceae bacterium]